MSDGKIYDEDYFLRGQESGKSLYSDYRWMPKLTVPMCQTIVKHCGISAGHRILDFGCARGYVVKALRELGYIAYGVDISEWAIKNADEETKRYLDHFVLSDDRSFPLLNGEFDWIIAKDVLEHVDYVRKTIDHLMRVASKGLFVVVPLSRHGFGKYVVEEYEKDVTHVQKWPLGTWVDMFLRPGWRVEGAYRVVGVKDNYAQHALGNGFITARRVE